MKHHTSAPIIQNKEIAPGHFELILNAPAISKATTPGQFVQIRVTDNLEPLLPRPMGISLINSGKEEIGILYKIFGSGTEMLSQKTPGEKITLTGPLGNAFWYEKGAKRVALVAGGTGIGPIVLLAEKTKKNPKLFGFLGARSKNVLCKRETLKKSCEQLYCSTDDGSFGHHGVVTDILEEKCKEHEINQIIAVGPTPMMEKAVAIGKKLNIPTQVSLEERMACGFGICLGCAVKLDDNNYHMICMDGPVFDGRRVQWATE